MSGRAATTQRATRPATSSRGRRSIEVEGIREGDGGTARLRADLGRRRDVRVAEMQRARLLLAFTELIATGGSGAASVEAVCRQAGISRRTFYEQFGDREACFLAAMDASLERLAQAVAPAFAEDRPWQERIRAALTVALEHLDGEPGIARMLVVETLRAGPEVLARRGEILEVLAEAVDQGRKSTKGAGRLPPLTAQGIIGGVLHLLQSSLARDPGAPLLPLVPDLMAIVVQPYMGQGAAAKQMDQRPLPGAASSPPKISDPFRDLPIRLTYRTARVLDSIARQPGASNRQVAEGSDITDQGQVSRLLSRLSRVGLIAKDTAARIESKGEPNAWTLTDHGHAVHAVLKER